MHREIAMVITKKLEIRMTKIFRFSEIVSDAM